MIYAISFHPQALDDIKKLKKTDKNGFKKLESLLAELQVHPYTGTGKPEKLKYDHSGLWSRQINQKHRLIYTVNDDEVRVFVVSTLGHYGDK